MILVDDEAIIREGISSVIPWEENGFFLAGVFEHGQQALEYIETHKVDVVLSDINMPRMDGLTLSRILGERFPDITVILLTGYDDFEYAQEAVKYQVREFLLKPITRKELSKVITTIKDELDRKQESRRAHEILLQKLEQSFPLLKERFLCRLLNGRLTRGELESRGDFMGWTDLGGFYAVVVVRFPLDWDDLDRFSLSESIREKVRHQDEVFFNRDEDLILFLQSREREELEKRTLLMAEEAFRVTSRKGDLQVSIGCGEVVDGVDKLEFSYKGAQNAVEYARILGLAHILSVQDIRTREAISPEQFNTYCGRIIENLKEGGKEKSLAALDELLNYLESHYLTSDQLVIGFMHFYQMLDAFSRDMDLVSENQESLLNQKDAFASLEKAADFFRNQIAGLDEKINQRRNDMLLSRIDRAKAIIRERFRESRFSLQDICDELYLSTSQFSLLFKEGTGQTFVEYLTACRVEEAKKLLAGTDLKGYEVAEKVGYTDPRYFTIIFKKQTGMTAMEYRRSRKI